MSIVQGNALKWSCIPREKIEHAVRLLTRTNYSNRRVARETGLSRGTVNKLASGERPPVGKEDNYHAEPIVQEPPERCPECGYLVTMPCVACRTREYQRELAKNGHDVLRDAVAVSLDNIEPIYFSDDWPDQSVRLTECGELAAKGGEQ